MNLKNVAILGYGNQGRAHALNLRDSKINVIVGARPGKGWENAKKDGFHPVSLPEAAAAADLVMLLLPDGVIPVVYSELKSILKKTKYIGFAHGFAYHFDRIEKFPETRFFLIGPKGAGAILREHYEKKIGLPGVYAVSHAEIKDLALAYAKAIGLSQKLLVPTTFKEEVECDLFGEQTVLCGGIFQLMEAAFEVLVKNGHSTEMAFLETCFEAEMILKLWMKYGPLETSRQISPTAFYGGLTRGRRLITAETKKELEKMFQEIQSGDFAKEWEAESQKGAPLLEAERKRLSQSLVEKTYQTIKAKLD